MLLLFYVTIVLVFFFFLSMVCLFEIAFCVFADHFCFSGYKPEDFEAYMILESLRSCKFDMCFLISFNIASVAVRKYKFVIAVRNLRAC